MFSELLKVEEIKLNLNGDMV